MTAPTLILASTSPARRSLMEGLRLPYRAISPEVDEEVGAAFTVRQTVEHLARRKAEAVRVKHPEALVLGSDQLVSLDGRAFGKPADADAAFAQLKSLCGRSHEILTGVCLLGPGVDSCEVDIATLTVFALSDGEIARYVATGEWQGCAGGYRIEGEGQALFSAIDGDRTSVRGLPMLRVVAMLRGAGVAFFPPR